MNPMKVEHFTIVAIEQTTNAYEVLVTLRATDGTLIIETWRGADARLLIG